MLPDALRAPLLHVQGLLDKAIALQGTGGWTKVWRAFKAMLPVVKIAASSLGVLDGLSWEETRAELKRKTRKELASNDYAKALSAFLTAMHVYLATVMPKWCLQWDSA